MSEASDLIERDNDGDKLTEVAAVEIILETLQGYSHHTIVYDGKEVRGWGAPSTVSNETARRQMGASADTPVNRFGTHAFSGVRYSLDEYYLPRE